MSRWTSKSPHVAVRMVKSGAAPLLTWNLVLVWLPVAQDFSPARFGVIILSRGIAGDCG